MPKSLEDTDFNEEKYLQYTVTSDNKQFMINTVDPLVVNQNFVQFSVDKNMVMVLNCGGHWVTLSNINAHSPSSWIFFDSLNSLQNLINL